MRFETLSEFAGSPAWQTQSFCGGSSMLKLRTAGDHQVLGSNTTPQSHLSMLPIAAEDLGDSLIYS